MTPESISDTLSSPVLNPAGKLWMASPVGKRLHLKDDDCNALQKCVPATPAQAFVPGAMVERKYDNGDLFRGHVLRVIESSRVCIMCGVEERDSFISFLTLVEPAPDKE